MDALVGRGYVEGWASAIKRDYKILERRGVVQVTTSDAGHRLTLLKPEIGEMARQLVLKGNASQFAAEMVVGTQAAEFLGPEVSRAQERRKDVPETRAAASRALNILRKSG